MANLNIKLPNVKWGGVNCKIKFTIVSIFVLIALLTAQKAAAQEAYVEITDGGKTLTFKYGVKPDEAFNLNKDNNPHPEWYSFSQEITKVVFDVSFIDARPTSCANWFSGCANLKEIIDIEKYLNTSQVEDMQSMFFFCQNLTNINLTNFNTEAVQNMYNMFGLCENLSVLDLRNFNTKNVTNMNMMFGICNSLTTILVSEGWSTESIDYTIDQYIFGPTPNIIGNAGTTFNPEIMDDYNAHINYANIDGGASNPGFLTTESYKVFYDLDNDGKIDDITTVDWEDNAAPPTSFALKNSPELPIPNPISKKGLKFKGWSGTPITDLSDESPQKNISIPADAVGNRIYTALWGEMYTVKFVIDGEEQTDFEAIVESNSKISAPTVSSKPKFTFHGWYTDEACTNEWNFSNDMVSKDMTLYAVWTPQDIAITIPETITYPEIPQENDAVCNGSDKYAILRFPLPEDVSVTKYELSIPDIITTDGTPETTDTGCEIKIPFTDDKTPGRYSGSIKLYINQNPVAKEYPLTIEVAIARNALLHLYKDVIFVNNHDGLYGKNGTYQWYHNDQEIPNANYQYLYDQNPSGKYKARMLTTDGVTVYSCPIDEGTSKKSAVPVKTYPNPAVSDEPFVIDILDYTPETSYSILISNSSGVIIKEIPDATEYTSVTLPRGIYSCALVSGGKKHGFKIIVK